MPSLVLASTSRFRRALLDRLGLPYEARAPRFEEIVPAGSAPREVARLFAEGKARSVEASGDCWVIGSDQVCEHEGNILGKTNSLSDCEAQLAALSGRKHALHSAVALFSPSTGNLLEATVTVELKMRKLSAAEIRRYVELEKPIGSAGGYFFESRGILLFDYVSSGGDGDDSAIVGLPLIALCSLLRFVDIEPLDLIR